MDEDDAQVLSDIATYGWHVVLIEEDEEGPSYGFSVGLFHTFQHPEIVVFGLSVDLLSQIINAAGHQVANGVKYQAGQEYDDLVENYRCKMRAISPRWYSEFLGYAQWFYKGDEFPALQCFWPDTQQKYPWEEGFFEPWRAKQPRLASDHDTQPET